ncbi:hypothetical protein BDV40DRAFT_278440 [Aspergillus tamarii]|uniref:LITAF domain-containing protein n=1 Tax=Aspergillus tamarii TaxID=41984 RepID=A0A5N6UFI7_ASPTM|nr:hypothetical protein BDV40DRAFT_278440 [Aspergillus tamarii]
MKYHSYKQFLLLFPPPLLTPIFLQCPAGADADDNAHNILCPICSNRINQSPSAQPSPTDGIWQLVQQR